MTGLRDHRVCVDLTHVVAFVLCLDISDSQCPSVMAVVDDVEPWDASDDVPADGQNHLPVDVDPGHLDVVWLVCCGLISLWRCSSVFLRPVEVYLVIQKVSDDTLQRCFSTQRNGDVPDVLGDARPSTAVHYKWND